MALGDDGLKSEAMLTALNDALAGRSAQLEDLLARHGGLPTPKPSFKLAVAFGAEVGARDGAVAKLLSRLGAEDAAPDTARVFLPVAAAHGWACRVRAGRDLAQAWPALAELAADERAPVRQGTLEALIGLGVRDGGGDTLIAHATEWLDCDDREVRFGAAAAIIETLGDKRVQSTVRDSQAMLDYLSRAIAEVAEAPRSAERSDGRRRALFALPRTLAVVAAGLPAGQGAQWLEGECANATRADMRQALSDATVQLRSAKHGQSGTVADGIRKVLEDSAKPLRDPSRKRPGLGRGKNSRRTR